MQRTLAFSRYLPDFGWNVTVLTVHRRAYREIRLENESLIPADTQVIRAPAWDTLRHFALRGRYLQALAVPDAWQSWTPGAVLAGLLAIRRERPAAIYSTYPIASAHVIGLTLAKLTGLPWVADFRDPMYQENYPPDPKIRAVFQRLERRVLARADRILVTTPGTARAYCDRYGERIAERIRVVPNGFDPEVLAAAAVDSAQTSRPAAQRTLTFLHSGTLYPYERDPVPFFRAVARLKSPGDPRYANIRIVFRASAYDEKYRPVIAELGLAEVVEFREAVPYHEAVAEMLTVDCLMIFQAANCNNQIPAKLYEALYVRRPIIGITDPAGDTGQLMQEMGVPTVARLESEEEITELLRRAIDLLREERYPIPTQAAVDKLSRRARTAELAAALDEARVARERVADT